MCGVQIGLGCSEIISGGFAAAREGQSNKQSLLSGCKIAFMVNMRCKACVWMSIMFSEGLQVMLSMVAKGLHNCFSQLLRRISWGLRHILGILTGVA